MAEVDFKTITIQGIISALFIVSMVFFVYQTHVDNNMNETILNDTNFNSTFNTLRGNLSNSQGIAENQSLNQDLSNPIAVFDFLSEAIVGTVKVFKAVVFGVYNSTLGLIQTKLGIDPIVNYSVVAMIITAVLFLGWRAWKRG